MENENGSDYILAQQSSHESSASIPVSAPAVQSTAHPTIPLAPVSPPVITTPSITVALSATASPVATVLPPLPPPPVASAPTPHQAPALSPRTTIPSRPVMSRYPGPPQTNPLPRFTQPQSNRQPNPDYTGRETGYEFGYEEKPQEIENPAQQLPLPLPTDILFPPRTKSLDSDLMGTPGSELDHVVPVVGQHPHQISIETRLNPTINKAKIERNQFARKAGITKFLLNMALGVQVLLGSLTTGLSAAALTRQQSAVATTVLGVLATLVAGYLARVRGTNEPESSTLRAKDLDQFIRKCRAFKLDFGHITTNEYDGYLKALRDEFDELLKDPHDDRKLFSRT